MKNAMMTVAETAARIEAGAILMVAGDESALAQLPRGAWIGGTSVYFMTGSGGREDRQNLFVTELDAATAAECRHVPAAELPGLAEGSAEFGATMILIPAFSEAHRRFALEGASYAGLFDRPLMGWVSGVALDEIGTKTPKVFDGATGQSHEDGAMLLRLTLPATKMADLDILNLFAQDLAGPLIRFEADGFAAETAIVDGQTVRLADYVAAKGIDTRLPLVANYAGALINVSFQSVDAETGRVQFYAPVVAGVDYRLATNPGPYAEVFASRISGDGGAELSCNCILNYLYGELEGKSTGSFTGPATFGEIAYILLNQTMVRLKLVAAEQAAAA